LFHEKVDGNNQVTVHCSKGLSPFILIIMVVNIPFSKCRCYHTAACNIEKIHEINGLPQTFVKIHFFTKIALTTPLLLGLMDLITSQMEFKIRLCLTTPTSLRKLEIKFRK
jgi:hypothetical protein